MEFINLIGKRVDELTTDELKVLLQHYESHEEKFKYEMKIRGIERAIRIREKEKVPKWVGVALEDKKTKEKWLKLGAYWKNVESMTTWYYKGEPFYRWFSGTHINNEILRVREADNRLQELVKGFTGG